MAELSGRVALITGGTKGLGLATAKLFAQRGADVYLGYRRDREAAEKAVFSLQELGVKAAAIDADLSEENGIDKLFENFQSLTPKLDFYIHNAAATAFKNLSEIKPHHVDKTFNITVKSFIGALPWLDKLMKSRGAVVTVGGMDTLKMVPFHGLLAAAKSALETLTKYAAHELAPRHIRVNGVNPGFMATESTQLYMGEKFDEFREYFRKSTPGEREPRLEEIAQVILFLCSEQSSWVLGQNLIVDGGQDFKLNF